MEACKSKNSICMGEVAEGEIVEVGRLRTMLSSRKACYRLDLRVVVCNPTRSSKKFPFICIKNNFLDMLKLKHLGEARHFYVQFYSLVIICAILMMG